MRLAIRRRLWKRVRRALQDVRAYLPVAARFSPAVLTGALVLAIPLSGPCAPATVTEREELLGWVRSQVPVAEVPVVYRREQWKHWIDADRDCQDTRTEVLIRAAKPGSLRLSANECTVVAGEWLDPYTGKTLTDPKKLDVDHVVPLKEATESGAASWDSVRRKMFANDLATEVPQLKAVSASANRAKGAKDVSEWLPLFGACQYVQDWAKVKHRWGLTMDAAEQTKILLILGGCQ